MVKKYPLIGLAAVFAISFFIRAGAEESATLGGVQLKGSESMIQNLLLVCDKSTLRYTFSGGSENGLKTLELVSGDKIVNYKDCNGAKECRMAGAVPVAELQNSVVTADVTGSDNREEKEKIKLNVLGNETKVYMISSVPETSSSSPVVIAEKTSDATSSAFVADAPDTTPVLGPVAPVAAPDAQNDIPPAGDAPVKGPVIVTKVVQNKINDYTLNITAKDELGLDFVEILENGVFMDVQICDKKPVCDFSKTIKNRKPGEYKYLIKSMNIKDGMSFQEEKISFSE